MKKAAEIKIALTDLSYLSEDDYVQPLPLNVGYLSAYLKQNMPGVKIDIFKDPQKLYDALVKDQRTYTSIGLSNYAWNFNLNRHFIELIKQKNPDTITVMGGPNIDSAFDEGLKTFFSYFNWLDFYVLGEGEYKFTRLMKNIIENEMNINNIWNNIPATVVGFNKQKNHIVRGLGDVLDCCDCPALPSPYLTGIMDEFLDNPHLVPIIETSRGCPYSCAYCCWGNSFNSKVRQFDKNTVFEELHYISLRGKNPKKALYLADSNFGINKQDKEIAQAINDINTKDGSYNNIYVFFAKNIDEDVIEIAEELKEFTDVSMSKQSLNPEVLRIIGRKNIPDHQYDRLYAKLTHLGVSTFCELIYGLPEESWESFLNGVIKMYGKRINVVLYPLLLFKGAKINSPEFRQEYQIKSAFRIMPRYLGSYGEINSAEYEEILISHAKVSEDDFQKFRLFVFFHVLFYEAIFLELIIFLNETHINLASFISFILGDRVNWPSPFQDYLSEFEEDVRAELIDQKNLKFYFSKEELEDIREKALDLNIYHFLKLISSGERAECFKGYLFEVLQRYLSTHDTVMDIEVLRQILQICFDKIPEFSPINSKKTVYYYYDLESWITKQGAMQLSSYKAATKIKYELQLDQPAINDFRAQYQKINNIPLSLYQTRKKMITWQKAPASAYTYKRTRL